MVAGSNACWLEVNGNKMRCEGEDELRPFVEQAGEGEAVPGSLSQIEDTVCTDSVIYVSDACSLLLRCTSRRLRDHQLA